MKFLLEMSPETARYIKLMHTMTKMCENCLNMLQNPDVIIASSVSFIILQLSDNLK